MKFGVSFLRLRQDRFVEVAQAAERLGYESVWVSEHLVLPANIELSPSSGVTHVPIPPDLPVYDVVAVLSHLAAVTATLRLGTWVYILPLRHPFVAARGFQTLDLLSGGRAEVGVGLGWIEAEYRAAGIDFGTRGRRMDEALHVCHRLWSEPRVEHHGEFFDFDPVAFEPKPVQRPGPRVHIGGESPAALRRAARHGDGWLAMERSLESLVPLLERVREAERQAGRGRPLEITAAARGITMARDAPDRETVARYEALNVDRLIVTPWLRSADAITGLERFAETCFL